MAKKRGLYSSIGLILLMLFLPLAAVSEGLEEYVYTRNGYRATIWKEHWESFSPSLSGFDTPEEFLEYAVNAMEQIVAWGGGTKKLDDYRAAGNDVILSVEFISTSGMSRNVSVNYGKTKQMATIALKDRYFSYGFAPIIHELTHTIYPIAYSRTLREGLASYVQDELCEDGTVHNYGLNPHEICQNVILPSAANQNLFGFVGSIESGRKAVNEQRSSFYVVSQSFMTYLIETYGVDTSLRIYSSMDEEAYIEQTGKTLEEIRGDWLTYLKQYESDFSLDTIRSHAYRFALEHEIPEEEAISFSEAVYQRFSN